jgi:hypothetical protein
MDGLLMRGRLTTHVRRAIVLLAIALLCCGCSGRPPPGDPDLAIQLRWLKSYGRESRSDVETGLLWTLSFLGATLPAASPDPLWWQGNVVTLRLDHAGIDAAAIGPPARSTSAVSSRSPCAARITITR